MGDTYTVCYARTRAVSAGAMIAMACNEIIMTDVGSFGDCMPISSTGKYEGYEREKIETEVRREFRESADKNGYDPALSQKMVSADLEVWLVRHKKSGQLQYVLADEWRGRAEIPLGVTSVPSNPSSNWRALRVVVPAGKLLTMHTDEAVAYGFVKTIIQPSLDDPYGMLMKHFNAAEKPTVLEDTWSETLVEILTSPALTGILFFIGILGIYVEFNAPGHILPGVVGVLCLAVVFGGKCLIGMADWWMIGLFVAGLILIGVELIFFATHGLLALLGATFCLVGLLAMLVPHVPGSLPVPRSQMDWDIFASGAFALGLGFVGAFIAAIVLAKYLPRIPIASQLVLASAEVPWEPPVTSGSPLLHIKAGDIGVVEGMCRPVGKVRFGEDLLDAAGEGDIIETGAKVRVLRVEGSQVFVERI